MQSINLLPWRQKKRMQVNAMVYGSLMFFFILGESALFLKQISYKKGIQTQENKNDIIRGKIHYIKDKSLQEKNKSKTVKAVIDRLNKIYKNQENTRVIMHFFLNDLKGIPRGIVLTRAYGLKHHVTLEGITDSLNEMRCLKSYLTHAGLKISELKLNDETKQWNLQAHFKNGGY